MADSKVNPANKDIPSNPVKQEDAPWYANNAKILLDLTAKIEASRETHITIVSIVNGFADFSQKAEIAIKQLKEENLALKAQVEHYLSQQPIQRMPEEKAKAAVTRKLDERPVTRTAPDTEAQIIETHIMEPVNPQNS